MENSPPSASSLEKQIDNFLEHFKRSASKAMEAEWCSIGGNSGVSATTTNGSSIITTTNTSTTTNTTTTETSCTQQITKQVSMDKQHQLLQRTRSRSSCLDLNNMMMEFTVPSTSATVAVAAPAPSSADLDSQLFSTLCEIDKNNYLYLFERCKQSNVGARQLRFLEKDHIRELIPKTHLGMLAEFEYLINQWKIDKGYIKPTIVVSTATNDCMTDIKEDESLQKIKTKTEKAVMVTKKTQTDKIITESIGVNTTKPMEVPRSSTSTNMGYNEDSTDLLTVLAYADNTANETLYNSSYGSPMSSSNAKPKYYDFDPRCAENYLLEKIIPLVLTKCIQNYKIKKLLTEGDRRLLACSIVDYFEDRRMKLRPDVMENIAEQISKHFPTEGKKAWYHRENSKGRGRLYMRFYNSHRTKEMRHLNKKRKMEKLLESSNSEEPVSTLLDDIDAIDNDEDSKRIQDFLKLKIKYEDFSEIIEMWEDTMKYRHLQIKYLSDFEGVREFLDNWPSYKLARGYELLSMDFETAYPNKMEIFRTRWLVYKQKILALLEAELKDNHCLEILTKYKSQQAFINEDSSSCALIYMIHAITKPYRVFKTPTGNVRYCITDSQYSMTRLIHTVDEMDEYHDAYPCIFVLGENLLDIKECYVVFLDIRYRLSYADCLVVCMQIFTLLKVDDPLPSLHFWQFIRGYLFNMPKDNERPYAVMENVVSYLESAGKK